MPLSFFETILLLEVLTTATVLSFVLFRAAAGSMGLTHVNMISYTFYVPVLLQTIVGTYLILCGVQHYVVSHVASPATIRRVTWAISYAVVALPTSMVAVARLAGIRSMATLYDQYTSPLQPAESSGQYFDLILLKITSATSVLAITYVFMVYGRPPFQLFIGTPEARLIALLRGQVTHTFPGPAIARYATNILGWGLTPVLAYVWVARAMIRPKASTLIWAFVMVVAALAILTYDFSKAPAIKFIAGMVFVIVLVRGRLSHLQLGLVLVAGIVGMIGMYLLTTSFDLFQLSRVIGSVSGGMTGRILLGQVAGTYASFEYFPQVHPHIWFASLSEPLSNLTGMEHSVQSARILMQTFDPVRVEEGTAGYMISFFVSEAWANFGLIGVLVSPWWVGAVIQMSNLILLTAERNPMHVGLLAYLSTYWLVANRFNTFMWDATLLTNVLIVVLITLLARALQATALRRERHLLPDG